MQILIVSQYFWPENFRINDLALALKDKGHDVTVLTGMPNYPDGKIYKGYTWWSKHRETLNKVSIIRVPLFTRRESKGWQLALNYLSFAGFGCLLAPWLLRGRKFDIVFAVNYSPVTVGIPAVLLAYLKRAPMFFWVQDLWPESLQATGSITSGKVLSVVGSMVDWIYTRSDKILVQSKSFLPFVVKRGVREEKLRYFPNWAESLYKPMNLPSGAKERCDVPNSGFVIMFAGNIGVAQSLDTIVYVADKLKKENIHWVFLGEGRRKEWLQQEVKKRDLEKVHILGGRPIDMMPAYFSLADVMLVTLKDDPVMSMTIPGKVQSYLACGKPILAALNGAGADVITESGAGYVVQADQVTALVEATRRMYCLDYSEREKMGKQGLEYFKSHFDRSSLVAQLEQWMVEENHTRKDVQ